MNNQTQSLLLLLLLVLMPRCDMGPGPFTCGGAYCPDDPPETTYQNILIDVQVTEFDTGNALSGATVTVHDEKSTEAWTGETNTLGQYTILLDGNQCYTVVVEYPRFESGSSSACSFEGSRDKANSKVVFQLQPVAD